MSFINESFNIGKKNMIVGNGKQDFDISSINGHEVTINGIVPGAGGGGGIPAIGDVSFEGNLNCNDQPGGGAKGIITAEKKIVSGLDGVFSTGEIKTGAANNIHSGKDLVFDGQDVYKSYPGVVPAIPNKTYKEYKNLIAPTDNNTFTGTNIFRNNAVSIQALNDDAPAVYENTITLNTNGNIQCNDINNSTEVKTTSVICENGSPADQLIKARQYHFRPKSTEVTGWKFSQKPPEDPPISADNYLMLQNTQTTGSFNLVKSTFDPQSPTPFDIILDPQNGQVKTTTSFDAPQINFRKNVIDNWSISQPASGQADQNILKMSAPSLGSQIHILSNDYSGINGANIIMDPSTDFNGGTIRAQTFFTGTGGNSYVLKQDRIAAGASADILQIKAPSATSSVNFKDNSNSDVLIVKGTEVELSNNIPLNFGSYSFRPQQYYKDISAFSFNHSSLGATNLIFNTNDTDWINKNTEATNQTINMGLVANRGAYKLTFAQTSGGSQNEINDFRFMSDIVLTQPNDNAPDVILPSATAFSYQIYDGAAPIITMKPGFLVYSVYAQFPQTSGNETSDVRITLTQMPYFA